MSLSESNFLPPQAASAESKLSLSDFQISDKGQVLSCPQNHAPAKVKKENRNSVGFDSQHCQQCPDLSSCPIKKGKRLYYLLYHPPLLVKLFLFIIIDDATLYRF
jgi:hypothetical protein